VDYLLENKIKDTLDRLESKDRSKERILEQVELENQKRKEVNALKWQDQQQNLQKEREDKERKKEKVVQKMK